MTYVEEEKTKNIIYYNKTSWENTRASLALLQLFLNISLNKTLQKLQDYEECVSEWLILFMWQFTGEFFACPLVKGNLQLYLVTRQRCKY